MRKNCFTKDTKLKKEKGIKLTKYEFGIIRKTNCIFTKIGHYDFLK
jgi:hypothetical protein